MSAHASSTSLYPTSTNASQQAMGKLPLASTQAADEAKPAFMLQPLTGANLLIKALETQGVQRVFGYPGGAIMPVYDALTSSSIEHILCRHEQAAAFAADAYARVTGKAGVVFATSGPGATNLITGIANAYLDSIPMVAITGQVASSYMGTDAFQEIDIFGMTLSCVKHSYIIRNVADIQPTIKKAFALAESGRPGPVLIDLPKDITLHKAPLAPSHLMDIATTQNIPAITTLDAINLQKARQLLAQSQKPLLYLGGGVAAANAVEAVREFTRYTEIPATMTLKALGTLPDAEFPLSLGMLGMHGLKAANLAMQECDLIICCGARFDDRVTGKLDTFAPHAKVIHIDISHAEIDKLRMADAALIGDMVDILEALHMEKPAIDNWRNHILAMKQAYAWDYNAPGEGIYAPLLLKTLSEKAGKNCIFTADVGQHQMWVAQHCQISHPRAHLSSSGLGAMGYGLPAGIGAKFAAPHSTVISVSGDGSIMMNIQELATLKRYNVPLKMLLLDNATLGMVRQWQDLFFNSNYSEVDLSDNPDFAKVAEAFGVEAITLQHRADMQTAIERFLNAKGPVLLHVKIDPKENVWPLVPPGKANHEMMDGE